jgi:hypothetical protein
MYSRDYYGLLKYLMERYGLKEEDMIFVENISDWCRACNIPEPDEERPFKFLSKQGYGSKMLIKENISDKLVNDRMKALSIRSQLKNVAFDRASLLHSDKERIVFLFLSELADTFPDIQDERLADDWVFEEIEKLGFFEP